MNAFIFSAGLITLALSACGGVNTLPVSAAVAPTLSAQDIAGILASADRSEADRKRDQLQKADRLLALIGVRPGMVVLDLSTGGGYTTELLARAVAPTGRVYGQSPPLDANAALRPAVAPEGAAMPTASPVAGIKPAPKTSPQWLAERSARPGSGEIISVVRKFEDPVPPELATNGLDLVTMMFNYHDLGHWGVDRARMNRAVFTALKPGGIYVIADHSGRPGTGISESGTLHRVEQSFLQREVEAAGFKLVDEGNFLRNQADPRDRNTPEPPQPKDEFIVKFVKPMTFNQ